MIPSQLWPIAEHLWQSTLFALFAGLLTLAFRNNRAAIRYGLWLAASIKFFLPFSILVDTGSLYQWRTATASSSVNLPSVIERVSHPFVVSVPLTTLAATPTASSSLLPTILLTLWALGFVAVLCSWYLRLRSIRVAMGGASPLTLPIEMPALTSREFSEPGVFGIFRPVLLLPTGIVNQLTPAQLEAVVAHELCHVRRRDNLTSVIHMAVEAVFWFHPLVWWLGARLVEEREQACDEEVLRNGHDPQSYAEGILKICELYLGSSLQCVAGVTGSNLKRRIETIMANPIALPLNHAKRIALTIAAAATVAVPVAIGVFHAPPLRAQAPIQNVEPPAQAPPLGPTLPNTVIPPKVEPLLIAQQTPPRPEKRLLVLLFDMSSMPIPDQLRTQHAAMTFIRAQMTESDMVSVMTYTTDINVLQDFSNDRELLLRTLNGLTIGEKDLVDNSKFNPVNADRKLAALGNAAKMLGALPGKKVLFYFTRGTGPSDRENQAQLNATVNAAIRNNVEFYLVDPRGIVATAGDATRASAIVLIMDSSSSMEGKKMESARAAALRLVQTLGPNDTLGILTFNNQFFWAVTPQTVENRATIDQSIANIIADGGTQIAPALTEAYGRILTISASRKHIIVLTDGVSETGNSLDLARAASNGSVTISTVGLGSDVNRKYLETIAQLSGGQSYFPNNPQDLEQILQRDVLEHSGSTTRQ